MEHEARIWIMLNEFFAELFKFCVANFKKKNLTNAITNILKKLTNV